MNIKDRILIKDQGPFKPGLEFDDGGQEQNISRES